MERQGQQQMWMRMEVQMQVANAKCFLPYVSMESAHVMDALIPLTAVLSVSVLINEVHL